MTGVADVNDLTDPAATPAPIGADLAGKVALITGGGTGIGRAAAVRLAARGVRVAVAGRRVELITEIATEIGGVAVPCDVADAAAVDGAVEQVVAELGGLHIVVNNAGVAGRASVADLDDEDWAAMIDINLVGPARVARAALPHLRDSGGGSIINVASVGALTGARKTAAYGTTKAGVLGLTRSMAVDFGPDGIRVNTLCPGWVATDMGDRAVAAAAHLHGVDDGDARDLLAGSNPIARMGEPDEIAACIEFLASDAASFVTGTTLVVDGGQTIVDLGTLPLRRPS